MNDHEVSKLACGDRVNHDIFGAGTVKYQDTEGSFPGVAIHFDNHGLKVLAMHFCAPKLHLVRVADPTDV